MTTTRPWLINSVLEPADKLCAVNLAQSLLQQLTRREPLSREQTRALFDRIVAGEVEQPLLAAILSAIATRGETAEEIAGAVEALRACVTPVQAPDGADPIDTCGTGGDGKPLFNVSTAAGIVAAAGGATVAKHGNRSHARPSGSAEGIAALGITTQADVALLERCLRECRIAFLFAPQLHPAMRHAAPVRVALGVRTIFNLVGPLANPAGVRRQLIGVSRPDHVPLILSALRELGSIRAMVVHGVEGLCDISISGPTRVGRLHGNLYELDQIDAADFGIPRAPLDALFVSSPAESAARIRTALDPSAADSPVRDMIVANAAGALWVAGLADDLADGALRARDAIRSGAAADTLARWRLIAPAPAN
ncbi:MAG: anthranilate phosphoribosyltransferase [Phycisphaerales bacterium]|nr:anthranilate phosphoribosyltransferase [Phycisphaerales bacterium]